MTGQAQQTAITRKLAAWAAILAVPTAIAGIYGMNFEHMPELKWRYGYFLVIGVIAAICSSLYWRFHRNGWV
jgi:magnesium transporter